MSVRVQCPSCGRSLLAREAALGSRSTCPACLAEITIPETEPPPEGVQADRPERQDHGPSCPNCGRDVEPIWVNCPWCEEPLRGRDDRRYGRPDLDVRRDRKSTGVVVIILAVLGAIGVAILFFNAFQAFAYGAMEPMVALAVGLFFLAGLTTLIVFLRSGGNPGADGFRRVVVGTLAIAGGLIAGGSCLVLSVIAFFYAVCLAGGMRGF